MIHLDSSFLIDLLRESSRGRPGPASALLQRLADEALAVSVYVACELQAGVELSKDPDAERERVDALLGGLEIVLPDEGFPGRYGVLLEQLERRGERIGVMDLLIATAAIGAGAALVTRNARHFERVPGLRVRAY